MSRFTESATRSMNIPRPDDPAHAARSGPASPSTSTDTPAPLGHTPRSRLHRPGERLHTAPEDSRHPSSSISLALEFVICGLMNTNSCSFSSFSPEKLATKNRNQEPHLIGRQPDAAGPLQRSARTCRRSSSAGHRRSAGLRRTSGGEQDGDTEQSCMREPRTLPDEKETCEDRAKPWMIPRSIAIRPRWRSLGRHLLGRLHNEIGRCRPISGTRARMESVPGPSRSRDR